MPHTFAGKLMAGLFDTDADRLPDELKDLRERLWAAYGDDPECKETLVKLINAMGFTHAQTAFNDLLAAKVFQPVGAGRYKLNPEA